MVISLSMPPEHPYSLGTFYYRWTSQNDAILAENLIQDVYKIGGFGCHKVYEIC